MTVSPLDLVRGLSRTFRTYLIALGVLVLLLVLIALGANRPADPSVLSIPAPGATIGPNGEITYAIGMIELGTDCKKVLIADTNERRIKGLSERRTVPESGMLFVYDHDVHFDFTMAKTLVPLDAGFFNAHGHRVDTVEMTPCPTGTVETCPRYHSKHRYRYVLETAHGQLGSGNLGACSV